MYLDRLQGRITVILRQQVEGVDEPAETHRGTTKQLATTALRSPNEAVKIMKSVSSTCARGTAEQRGIIA